MLLFQVGSVFPNMLQNMQNMGFFLYLFPFLLALAIFYGILTWTLGGRIPKSGVALISIVLAFFVMLYASWNTFIVSFFANLGGAGLIVGSGILFVAILLGIMGFKIEDLTKEPKYKWIFIIGVVVIGILIFIAAGGSQFGLIPDWSNSGEFWTIVFFIVVVAIAMLWLGNDSGGAPAAGGEKKG